MLTNSYIHYPRSYDDYVHNGFEMLHMRHSHDNDEYSSGWRILLCSEFAEVLEDKGIPVRTNDDNRFIFRDGYILIGWNKCYLLYYSTRANYTFMERHDTYDSRMESYKSCISHMTGGDMGGPCIWHT